MFLKQPTIKGSWRFILADPCFCWRFSRREAGFACFRWVSGVWNRSGGDYGPASGLVPAIGGRVWVVGTRQSRPRGLLPGFRVGRGLLGWPAGGVRFRWWAVRRLARFRC